MSLKEILIFDLWHDCVKNILSHRINITKYQNQFGQLYSTKVSGQKSSN